MSATKTYLQAYNAISALLWFVVLSRVILLVPLVGFDHVFGGVGTWTRNVQSLAVLEVLHSAFGLVRAPLSTTALQVLSRIIVVWGICDRRPATVPTTPFYSTMLLAWSVTEVVRYTYFVFALRSSAASSSSTSKSSSSSSDATTTGAKTGRGNSRKGGADSDGAKSKKTSAGAPAGVPDALVWLRYSLFYVLYPLGISSECAHVVRALLETRRESQQVAGSSASGLAAKLGLGGLGSAGSKAGAPVMSLGGYETGIKEEWLLWLALAAYVPGSYVLYNYMRLQRRKVLGERRKTM